MVCDFRCVFGWFLCFVELFNLSAYFGFALWFVGFVLPFCFLCCLHHLCLSTCWNDFGWIVVGLFDCFGCMCFLNCFVGFCGFGFGLVIVWCDSSVSLLAI